MSQGGARVAEEASGKALTDDADLVAAEVIGGGEGTSGEQRDLHGREEAGADRVHVQVQIFTLRGHMAGDGDVRRPERHR